MFGYAFIYIDSRQKQTLMNPLCGLIWSPLTIKLVFQFFREPRKGDYHTNTQQVRQKMFIDLKIM
jgi:hypothetical protein